MKLKLVLSYFLVLMYTFSFAQRPPKPFVKGDRVVFAGNSITEHGFYEAYIWLYYMTHFPERRITVFNGGIGGDISRQIYIRLDSDLLAKKPTVMSVNFGMNDSRYFEYWMHKNKIDSIRRDAIDSSYKWFKKIIVKLDQYPGIRKIMLTSSSYDETTKNGKDPFWGKYKTMEGIIKFQKKEAIKNNWAYVDLFYPMTQMNKKGQEKDTSFTLTGPDRIHPGNAGHLVMAYMFLKAQGLANKPVSDVLIDAPSKKVVKADNATISSLADNNNTFSFNYYAKSLPFPIDSVSRIWGNPQKQYEALKVIPFIKEFDQEILQLNGLNENTNYLLSIDGRPIKTFTGKEFSNGVNLAILSNTPQYRQAKKVMNLQLQHKTLEDEIRAYYWINYDYLYNKGWFLQDSPAITDSIMAEAKKNPFINGKKEDYRKTHEKSQRDAIQKQMKELEDEMYRTARPVFHKVTIKKED